MHNYLNSLYVTPKTFTLQIKLKIKFSSLLILALANKVLPH